MSDINVQGGGVDLGTLMWVGDAAGPEFKEAYEYCVSNVSQLALRRNLDDALCRPASNVRCILFAQSLRRQMNHRLVDVLLDSYPQASVLSMLGSLCEGLATAALPNMARADQVFWHGWNQVLPKWLRLCGAVETAVRNEPFRSVAVVASTMATGEPLLDLAESAGVTAVWCQTTNPFHVRNVDVVWWDDSVAGPASAPTWRTRISSFETDHRSPRHAWIANAPRYHQCDEAKQGGIDVVISKPHRIECLLEMFDDVDVPVQGASQHSTAALRAA